MRFVQMIMIFWVAWICSCRSGESPQPIADSESHGIINDSVAQDSLFKVINQLTGHRLGIHARGDSLEFLFLPVTASCPACRKKTIDSIVKYQRKLDSRHYVIITGGGLRTIGGYFSQQEHELPYAPGIYYDTTGLSRILTSTNPNVYFATGSKVYRKVSCTPATIKSDLAHFFGGLAR
jgi:hypothetical protein